jgi:hypothetical protein
MSNELVNKIEATGITISTLGTIANCIEMYRKEMGDSNLQICKDVHAHLGIVQEKFDKLIRVLLEEKVI